MDKRIKWGIIIIVGAGLIGGGIYSQMPKQNAELAAADKVTLSILGMADLENTITDIVTDISNGKAIYTSLGTTLYPYKHIVTY